MLGHVPNIMYLIVVTLHGFLYGASAQFPKCPNSRLGYFGPGCENRGTVGANKVDASPG